MSNRKDYSLEIKIRRFIITLALIFTVIPLIGYIGQMFGMSGGPQTGYPLYLLMGLMIIFIIGLFGGAVAVLLYLIWEAVNEDNSGSSHPGPDW